MPSSSKLLFSDKELLDQIFLQTDLGRLYLAIPFEELAKKIPVRKHEQSGQGCKPWFDIKGGIALLILKHYHNLSDELLLERINTDWSMQMFCGISLSPGVRIKDRNIVSNWRVYLAQHLLIRELQEVCAKFWKPYMSETNIGGQDATCYESGISFPTDIKLLWECCQTVFNFIQDSRKELHLRKSRARFHKQRAVFMSYQKLRKRSKRKEKRLRKFLLKLLLRLMKSFQTLSEHHQLLLSKRKQKRLKIIGKVYAQQHERAYGPADTVIKDRIVSLSKPYVRPIVRGKESKPVEFGPKVNKLVVDGISFIEHLSFDAFNESTRYKEGIFLQRKYFGKCTHHSGDAIYATNENRKYASTQGIQTNFVPKGKQKAEYTEQSAKIRALLNKNRSTVLEGSFGNEKNHYMLNKSRARTEETEVAWIFFGMMTSNASIIAKRIEQRTIHRQVA